VRLPDTRRSFCLLTAFLLGLGSLRLWAEPETNQANTLSTSNALVTSTLEQMTKPQGEKIELPVPVGEPVKGIKIPQYDQKGTLTMNLIAETAKKLDERQVEFGKLKVQFDDQEQKEIVVEIPHSIIDLETKVLVSDTPTTIRREDFDIVGQGAEFDTVSRRGILKGHVTASFRNPASVAPTPQPSPSQP
jgi:hypothetical protein